MPPSFHSSRFPVHRPFGRIRLRLLYLPLVIVVSGCATADMLITHIGGVLSPSDFNYPAENFQSARTLALHGTVAPSMQLKLLATYRTDGSMGCRTSTTFMAGAVQGIWGPSTVNMPVSVERTGNQYSAVINIDQFLPGRCEWHFEGVHAILSANGLINPPNQIVRAGDGLPELPAKGGPNGKVRLYCDFRLLLHDLPNTKPNACVMPAPPADEQREYLYSPVVRTLEASFFNVRSLG